MEQRPDPPDAYLAPDQRQESPSCRRPYSAVIQARIEARKQASLPMATLMVLLKEEADIHRDKRGATIGLSTLSLLTLLYLLSDLSRSHYFPRLQLPFQLFVIGLLSTLWILIWGGYFAARYSSLPDALSPFTDKKQIGPLIRALQAQNRLLRNFAKQNLIHLLPTLNASDASLLRQPYHKILLQHLAVLPDDPRCRDLSELRSRRAYRREMDLRLGILKAFEQVGGEQEIAAVTRLAGEPLTQRRSLKVPAELRAAAQACLPHLQNRAEDQRADAQLLRASTPSALPTDDLLRPIASVTADSPEQLLRAETQQS